MKDHFCADCIHFVRWQKDWDERTLPVKFRWLGECRWSIKHEPRWENDGCAHSAARPDRTQQRARSLKLDL